MVATVVDEIGIGALELGNDGGIIAVARVDPFDHHDLDASFFTFALDRAGDTLTIGLLVMQDGNRRRLDFFYDELGSGRDRKSVVWGQGVSVRVALGGRRSLKQNNRIEQR